MANCADDVLSIARGEIGYSRFSDPEPGSKYGRWYADLVGDSYYGVSGVPYCAMFQSWVFAQAGATATGLPGAYCPWILNSGRNEGALVSCGDAQPGDLLLFDWGGDGVSDHIGMCEENYPNQGYMQTIEGNTNNGQVARRTRGYSYIIGVIRPTFDGSAAPSPAQPSGELDIDGWFGTATITKLQEVLGTTVDGVVSSQPVCNQQYIQAAGDGWEWVDNRSASGSDCMRALQGIIGADQDGFFGTGSVNSLEAYYGIPCDGVLSGPSDTVMCLQRALNDGRI